MGVATTEYAPIATPSLWSMPFNANPSDNRIDSAQWCQSWAQDEPVLDISEDNLPQCPCTLRQAKADVGTFEPSPWCNEDAEGETSCPYRSRVVHCVRARKGRYALLSLELKQTC